MDVKLKSKSETISTILACASLGLFETALVLIAVRRWPTLSGLSHFWFVYLGASFAMLWYCQLREKGKIACLAWTCLASVGALWTILNPR
jgi:hypothetical protein